MEARKRAAAGGFGRACKDIGVGMFGQSGMELEKVFGIP